MDTQQTPNAPRRLPVVAAILTGAILAGGIAGGGIAAVITYEAPAASPAASPADTPRKAAALAKRAPSMCRRRLRSRAR